MKLIFKISPWSASPFDPNGHNVAVSMINDAFYVNDDTKPIYQTSKDFVQKHVSVLLFK